MTDQSIRKPDSELLKSFRIQCRVVGALLMREILTRYGRHNLGFMWLFLEPMLFTTGVTLLWYQMRGDHLHNANISIIAFTITGYSTVLLWRNTTNRCINAIAPNFSLLHHRNVKIIDLFTARILLEFAGATISLIVLMGAFTLFGLLKPPADMLTMIYAWLLFSWFAAALALIVGIACSRSELLDRIWHTLTYLLFPLSGALFLVEWLPPKAQEMILWIPMVHLTEMLRHGFFGGVVKTYEDPVYVLIVNTIMSLVGLVLIRQSQNTLEAP